MLQITAIRRSRWHFNFHFLEQSDWDWEKETMGAAHMLNLHGRFGTLHNHPPLHSSVWRAIFSVNN